MLAQRFIVSPSCLMQDRGIHWNAASAQFIYYHRYFFG